jgi:uncharacterized membrane protein YfcA
VGLKFILIAVVSAVIGAVLANSIDVNILRKLFAIYLIIIGSIFVVSKSFE